MTVTELKWTNLPGPLVNFKTQEYMYTSIGNFIIHEEEFKDFVIIDEHIADVVMRCNSHGIKTYFWAMQSMKSMSTVVKVRHILLLISFSNRSQLSSRCL